MAYSIHPLALLLLVSMSPCIAIAGSEKGHYVAPVKRGTNKDAMTMQECRDRLAAPSKERPPSDDPRVNLDAMCLNMLSTDKAFLESQRAKAASSPSARDRSPQSGGQARP